MGKRLNPAACDACDFASSVVNRASVVPINDQSGREADIRRFLELLFGNKPEELWILIWHLAGKRSVWCHDIAAAVAHITSCTGEDLYVGVVLSREDRGPHKRCEAKDAAAIVGMWLDLDVLGDGHTKKNLPPTAEDALSLIPPDLPASVIVASGHGLQLWFLFERPMVFNTNDDRETGKRLADRFKALIKRGAAARGWDVDCVSDLARVMRVPGTTNNKVPAATKPVRLLEVNRRRYTPEEISSYLDAAGIPGAAASVRTAQKGEANWAITGDGEFDLNPTANPPVEKFEALREVEERFKRSWNHQREFGDQSASSYDLSLATFAAMASWSDQEIVDLLVAHRRKWGADLKLRPDYYRRTISKAREAAAPLIEERAADPLLGRYTDEPTDQVGGAGTSEPGAAGEESHQPEGAPEAGEVACAMGGERGDEQKTAHIEVSATTSPEAEPDRTTLLKALPAKLKVQIRRIIKFDGERPEYRLETAHGEIPLGNVNGLIQHSKLRSSIAARTGQLIPTFRPQTWPGIARMLLAACEIVDRGSDATLQGTVGEWLRQYLDSKLPHQNLTEADEGREPFFHDGQVCIFSGDLRRWLCMRLGEKVHQDEVTMKLRAFGATPEKFSLTVGGKETSRSAWKLPAGVWAPVEGSR